MEAYTQSYLEKEFFAACPLPPQDMQHLKIQMRSERGSSKWLSVTPEEWKQIERLLLQRLD